MNDILVSVIVPVYNVEKYVEKCILSILGQSYNNFELILLNDGSTDGSYNILLQYRDNPHVVIVNKKNTGQSDTRYEGLLKAKGEFVYFVDSDDYIEGCSLDKLVCKVKENNADVAFGRYRLVNVQGITLREQNKYNTDVIVGKENILRDALCNSNFKGSLCIKLIRRKLLLASYLDDIRSLRVNEDICLSIILASHCHKVVFVNDLIYNVLQRDGSVSRNINPSLITINDEIFEIIKNRLREINLWNTLINYYYKGYAKTLLFALGLAAYKCRSYKEFKKMYDKLPPKSLYYNQDFIQKLYHQSFLYRVILGISRYPQCYYYIINLMKSFIKY